MSKTKKVVYWVSTVWLALGMTSTGIVQLTRMKEEVANFNSLGYPLYLMTLIGSWKMLGVLAILVPKFPLLKEWAYAGFFFAMSGAIVSHLVSGHGVVELFGPGLLGSLTVVSWYFRPAGRRLIFVK